MVFPGPDQPLATFWKGRAPRYRDRGQAACTLPRSLLAIDELELGAD